MEKRHRVATFRQFREGGSANLPRPRPPGGPLRALMTRHSECSCSHAAVPTVGGWIANGPASEETAERERERFARTVGAATAAEGFKAE